MLNFANTRVDRSTTRPVNAGLVLAEGACLVRSGTGVAQGTGASGEQFLGFSFSQQNTPTAAALVETITVPAAAPYTVTLSKTPVGAVGTINFTPAPGTAATLSGNVLTFDAADAGKTIQVTYVYAPTVVEARFLQGDVLPGGDSGHTLGTVGIILAGDVYTNCFDTAIDWAAAATAGTALKIGANGIVTTAGSGGTLTGVRVIALPNATTPFLGLSIDNG